MQALLWLASFWVLLTPAWAFAQSSQGFFVDRFEVAERGSDWFVGDSLDLRGSMRPSLGLVFEYAYRPLVLYAPDGDLRAVIVSDQLFAHVGGSFVFADRVRLAFNLPVAILTEGESARARGTLLAADSGPSFGDARFGADLRLIGEYGGPGTLAIGAQLYVPSGSRDSFTGDGRLRAVPHLLFAGRAGPIDYSARASLDYRAQHDVLAGVPHGTEISGAVTAGVALLQHTLLMGPELWGSTTLVRDSTFHQSTSPLELLLGVHWRPKNFRMGLGIGPGLTRGVGSPTLRAVAMFEWSPSVIVDRDGDGVLDGVDACPDVPGEPNSDPSKNGCPLVADRDLDSIPDAQDACPDVPGVASTDPAKHGCPPPGDRDHDGVLDRDDDCPDVAGVASPLAGRNGCPPDNDGDGILDAQDACPTLTGVPDPDPLKNGCPLARIEKDQIVITQRIEFEFGSATLLESSFKVLVAVMNVMREHPELGIVLVEGHTDNIGGAAYNKDLSERRAKSVRKWLIDHGVEEIRLLDGGFGLERPLDTNDSAEGRQRNRRVEFHILEQNGKRLETIADEVP